MQIKPSEIAQIEEAGQLDGNPVKLIRTKGGFWIAAGRPKGKMTDEALAAGSHPAIVKYNLEKQFPNFQPAMMKSELLSDSTVVDKHSHFLSDDLRKSGYDIYSIQNGPAVDFQITKHNAEVAVVNAEVVAGSLVITKIKEDAKEFVHALAGATSEKAIELGVKKIKAGK